MSGELRHKMEAQLPKFEPASFPLVFNYIAGIASIIGLVSAPIVVPNQSTVATIYAICLGVLIFCLLAFTWLREKRKLHRYAQAIYYTHFVNHCIRDLIGDLTANPTRAEEFDGRLKEILDAIAVCFSVVAGKRCRASLIELVHQANGKSGLSIHVRLVDSVSRIENRSQIEGRPHSLADNTEFDDLCHSKNGHFRYYLCNDLPRAWRRGEYRSSYVHQDELPRYHGPLDVFMQWRFPYRSVMAIPIRYTPKAASTFESKSLPDHDNQWGFLRIDCNTRHIFDFRQSVELGGTFSDALFTLFQVVNMILDRATDPHLKESSWPMSIHTTTIR